MWHESDKQIRDAVKTRLRTFISYITGGGGVFNFDHKQHRDKIKYVQSELYTWKALNATIMSIVFCHCCFLLLLF